MNNLLAENILKIGDQEIKDIAALPDGKEFNIVNIVNAVVTFLIPLAAVILFGILVWGGFEFLTSYGDPEKLKSGKAKITSGLIGFVLLISSYIIVKIIANIFGLGDVMF